MFSYFRNDDDDDEMKRLLRKDRKDRPGYRERNDRDHYSGDRSR